MKRFGDLIVSQSKRLLENKQQAILFAAILAVLPFASWLSVALVALVTLRRGAKSGFEVMLPALVVHSVPLMMLVSLDNVIVNTLLTYLPCYFAALVLRKAVKWQSVFGFLLWVVTFGCLAIHLLVPAFVIEQFEQFKPILVQYDDYKHLIDSNPVGLSFFLAQLFFGLQILIVVVSSIMSLMFARLIQAKLFMPGGFKEELIAFRGGRLSFLALLGFSVATYFEIPLAMNVLPLVLCYFLLAGFSLLYFALARKSEVRVFILLLLLILVKPIFVLFAYIVFGSLDSIFNFRLYLPARVREST